MAVALGWAKLAAAATEVEVPRAVVAPGVVDVAVVDKEEVDRAAVARAVVVKKVEGVEVMVYRVGHQEDVAAGVAKEVVARVVVQWAVADMGAV